MVAGVDPFDFRPDQALVFWLSGTSPNPLHPFTTRDGYQIVNGVIQMSGGSPVRVQRTPLFDFDQSRLQAKVTTASDGTTHHPGITNLITMYSMYPSVSNVINDNAAAYSYFPQGVTAGANGAPYVYFDANFYAAQEAVDPPMFPRMMFNDKDETHARYQTFPNAGPAQQYAFDQNGNGTIDSNEGWANPESFQIIACGTDGKFANPALDASGNSVINGNTQMRLYPTGTGYDGRITGVVSQTLYDDDNVTNFCSKARLGDDLP